MGRGAVKEKRETQSIKRIRGEQWNSKGQIGVRDGGGV